MRNLIAAVICALVGASPALAQTDPPAASAATQSDLLAAESLRESALALRVRPDATGWAQRLVALTRFADRLAGNDPRTARVLAQICETQDDCDQAAQKLSVYLAANPNDHATGVRWMSLSLDSKERAEERTAFLQAVLERKDLPPTVRAIAAVQWAKILRGQAKQDDAARALETALKLDPHLPEALTELLATRKDPSAADHADVMLRMLTATAGSPQAAEIAGNLAALLDSLGLQKQSLDFYAFAWRIDRRLNDPKDTSYPFVLQYFSAILDAAAADRDLAGEAIRRFEPMRELFPGSADLDGLLIEACRLTGDDERAERLTDLMEKNYESKKSISSITLAFATELAWFYLVTRPHPEEAMAYARQAEAIDRDNPVVRRVLGAAELLSKDHRKQGIERLGALLDKDMYAGVFLAEHWFADKNETEARKALLAAAALGRSGHAFRRLLAVAAEHDVKIPPAEGAADVAEVVKAFNKRILQMGLVAEEFIAVEIRPVSRSVLPGEPVLIETILTNTGSLPVPLGETGLLSPVMSLEATVAGSEKRTFTDLPPATWSAPRYLQPGQSVSARVRLDVGDLGEFLRNRCMDEVELTVSGTLDPVRKGKTLRSRLPSVPIKSAVIKRLDILGEFDRSIAENFPPAYQRRLGLIVRDMKRGDLPRRMLAARQVASLLATARQVEMGKAAPPARLTGHFTKPVMLTMMREVLRDASPVVRSEMLASLQDIPLDAGILRLLAAPADDPSALVRFRLAELLGDSGGARYRTILNYLARDADPLVCLMVSAFKTR